MFCRKIDTVAILCYNELPSVFITDEAKFTKSRIPVYETIEKEGVLYYGEE